MVNFSLMFQHKIPYHTVILRLVLVRWRHHKSKKELLHMSIRATLVTIIGALLFFTTDVVFCIAIIEFSVVKSVGGKFSYRQRARPLKKDGEQ